MTEIVRAASVLTSKPTQSTVNIKPFTSPIITSREANRDGDGREVVTVDMTPRLWSYFEVGVMERDRDRERTVMEGRDEHEDVFVYPSATNLDPCVAIGLSTSSFPLGSKMPGWDANSFGYHSDDGGVFRNNGDMVREFGPKWGEGDVVGCGVYYAEGGGR